MRNNRQNRTKLMKIDYCKKYHPKYITKKKVGNQKKHEYHHCKVCNGMVDGLNYPRDALRMEEQE